MWEKLTAQQKDAVKAGFILAFVLFAGVGAYWYQFAKPEMDTAEKKVADLNGEIGKLKDQLREMDQARENLEKLKEKQKLLEEVAAKLPSTVAPEDFFKAFEEILKVTRVSYTELKPLPLLERAIYTEIPYQLVGAGRYHDFGQFLNLVEENPNRLMRIKTFVIENDDSRPSVHPLKVQLATFKFNKKG
jgi:Tfp pilus assembly protein PilO